MNTNQMASLISRFLSLSPAYLAFMLLFGMLLSFAAADLSGIKWHSGITITLYASTLAWSLVLTWNRRRSLSRFNIFDLLLSLFILVIMVSILVHGRGTDMVTGYPRYLPFLLVAPYLTGRLMTQQDIEQLARMLVYVGIAILPVLLWDAHTSPAPWGRQQFFGVSHTPLLVGGLLAFTLLAVGTRNDIGGHAGGKQILQYVWMGLIAGFLVWVSARGWLIGAIFGFLAVISGSWRNRGLRKTYFFRLAFVLAMMWTAFSTVPHYSYDGLISGSDRVVGRSESSASPEFGPILGAASCRPIVEGRDSVAIRWVLYQEAVALFMQAPLVGSGAGLFGEHSCLGASGYPHSSLLQSFSELGIVGGTLLVALLVTAVITLFKLIAREENLAGNTYLLLALAFLAMYLFSDQIYGNYFVASGTYFTVGVVAALYGRSKRLNWESGSLQNASGGTTR